MLLDKFKNEDGKMVSGKNIKFSCTCDRCGGNARMLVTQFYENGHQMNPKKITLKFKCGKCKNEFTSVIY